MRSCAIVIALAVGYALAGYLGRLDFTGMHQAEVFQVPVPLHFGLGFSWALFIPMLVIYLVTSLEAIGDVTATSKVSRQPVEGPVWMQRIKGGVLVNGASMPQRIESDGSFARPYIFTEGSNSAWSTRVPLLNRSR